MREGCLDLPSNIRETLRQFLATAMNILGPGTRIYLFGSFARGDWLVDSDVDLIVVSPGLKDIPWHERYPVLRKLLPPSISVEILAYTPGEFETVRRRSAVLRDAEKYWVELTPGKLEC
ncbi:MAG: nucleotidyltransferase domain-containing protein [Vulcanisaeta sp.]|uniref:nucleotidyltransferase domain-containing protein n=1 Tax=Vulcanisaeta sp. TaxID=2020871 RepID=UPI003D0C9E06